MFKPDKVKLGIAPIAWTNDDLPDLGKENSFEQCISEMALAGFAGTEIGTKYPRDPKKLRHMLDLRGLEIANAWFSSFLTTKPYGETESAFVAHCDFLKAVGAGIVGVSEQGHSIQGQQETPIFTSKYVLNDGEWKLLTDGLNRLGKIALDKGLRLTFHHHMGTVVQTAAEVDRMLVETDPGLVGLLYDSGHFVYSGDDPVAMLKKHIGRVRHVHLKDTRTDMVEKVRKDGESFLQGVRMGTFTIPGDGDGVDFPAIFRILDAAGYEGWMLVEAEQDPAKANPFEYALKARAYIREQTGL